MIQAFTTMGLLHRSAGQFADKKTMEADLPRLDIKLLRLLDSRYATHRITRSSQALTRSHPNGRLWLRIVAAQLIMKSGSGA